MGIINSQPAPANKDLDDFVLVKQTLKTPPISLYWKEASIPPLLHICVHHFAFNLQGFSSKLKLLPADLKNKIIVYCLRHEITTGSQLALLIDENTRALNLHATKTKDEDLQNILVKCPDLEELDISGNLKLSDDSLQFVVAKCKKIKKLNLAACLRFSPQGLMHVSRLQQLEELNLYYCGSGQLTTCVEAIARHCPNLVGLNVGGMLLPSTTITCLATHCSQLMALNLCGCKISDEDMRQLSRLTRVISLNISSNSDLTKIGIAAISAFKNLQKLDLFGIGPKYLDEAMIEVFKACPQLEELSLASCTSLTDEAVLHLAEHCPRLVSVQLSNTHVTDAGVITLLEKCHYLRRMYLSATAITDQSLRAIGTARLDDLDISFCAQLSEHGIKQLVTDCDRLQRVVLSQQYGLDVTLLRATRPYLLLECPEKSPGRH